MYISVCVRQLANKQSTYLLETNQIYSGQMHADKKVTNLLAYIFNLFVFAAKTKYSWFFDETNLLNKINAIWKEARERVQSRWELNKTETHSNNLCEEPE